MVRSTGKHSIKPRRKLARILAVGTSGVLIAAFGPDIAAHAVATYASTTSVAVLPATQVAGQNVKMTATIKVIGLPNLGIVPAGSVTFTSTNSIGGTANLGTKYFGCLAFPCKISLGSTKIPVGTVSVTATYSGEPHVTGSSGSTPLTITPNPAPTGTTQTVTCYSGQPCDSGTVTSSDDTTTVQVTSDPSTGNQTLSVSTGKGTLHCKAVAENDGDGDDDDGVFVGALATFSSTATDVSKTITYTGTGATGATMNHQYGEHTQYAGCYGSPTQFNGYTNGVYGPAPYNNTDKLYVAMLSNCANNSGALPCMTNVAGSGYDSYVITAPGGDPKGIG